MTFTTTEMNISIRSNEDRSDAIVFRDEDTSLPFDWTGNTFRMDIKVSVDDVSEVKSLTTASGGIASTDLANSTITIVIPDFDVPVGSYVYDLIMILSGSGFRQTLAFGTFTVVKGVTGA